jgi:peroxiredoxin
MPTRRFVTAVLCLALAAPAARSATIPRKSPEFAIDIKGGKQVLLSSYKGKVVGLVFILTYCAHCQKTIEALKPLQQEYGPRGFQVLASAIEDMAAAAIPDFLRRFDPPFPVGYSNRLQVLEYLQIPVMNRLMMPQMAFIDRNGTIRAQYAGEDPFFNEEKVKANLTAQIESFLKETSGAPAGKKSAPKKKK